MMGTPNWSNRTLWTGDNLDIMRGMNSETVDLIYLDPPFNSNKNYSAPIGSEAAGAAFKDTWTFGDADRVWMALLQERDPSMFAVIEAARVVHGKGMAAYIGMMAQRLWEMHRLLKSSGSIYLHCDPTTSHYLKVLMDAIFGPKRFRNEIIWHYRRWTAPSGDLQKLHDVVLWYCKDRKQRTYNTLWVLPANVEKGRREGYEADEDGRLYRWQTAKGKRYRIYRDERGVHAGDVWPISFLHPSAKERVGYPTQKPLALLERIVRASSNPGDLVLDPFCGCATACVAAEKLQRQWNGIDIATKAAELVRSRLQGCLDEVPMYKNGDVIHRTDQPHRTDLGKLPPPRSHLDTLYGKQDGLCGGCGERFPKCNLTMDHMVPRKRGGTDHIENLWLLCGACNSSKGTRTQKQFLQERMRKRLALFPWLA